MDTKYKIAIPKPCHEDWNKMTPAESGRFCGSCAKSVVDFTQMNDTEIQSYFFVNQGKNVCGRFKNKQLESIIIKIPSQAIYSQVHFHKMFLLALLINMGTTLFSCSDKNGNKQKIDGVEVVDDISHSDYRTVGEIAVGVDSLIPPPPPLRPKIDEVKFVKPNEKKVEINTIERELEQITAGMFRSTLVEPIKDSIK